MYGVFGGMYQILADMHGAFEDMYGVFLKTRAVCLRCTSWFVLSIWEQLWCIWGHVPCIWTYNERMLEDMWSVLYSICNVYGQLCANNRACTAYVSTYAHAVHMSTWTDGTNIYSVYDNMCSLIDVYVDLHEIYFDMLTYMVYFAYGLPRNWNISSLPAPMARCRDVELLAQYQSGVVSVRRSDGQVQSQSVKEFRCDALWCGWLRA